MISPERIKAFVEYVLRPLSEDWRIILEKVKELDLPLTEESLTQCMETLGKYHLAMELLRSITYILITFLVCRAVIVVLS
jgi:hypothetical protein